MERRTLLSLIGQSADSAGAAPNFSASAGDKVCVVRCRDEITGDVTHDIWIARKDGPSWTTSNLTAYAKDNAIDIRLVEEAEILQDADGQLYADLQQVRRGSALASALEAISKMKDGD
jgi:hypothetical protein